MRNYPDIIAQIDAVVEFAQGLCKEEKKYCTATDQGRRVISAYHLFYLTGSKGRTSFNAEFQEMRRIMKEGDDIH